MARAAAVHRVRRGRGAPHDLRWREVPGVPAARGRQEPALGPGGSLRGQRGGGRGRADRQALIRAEVLAHGRGAHLVPLAAARHARRLVRGQAWLSAVTGLRASHPPHPFPSGCVSLRNLHQVGQCKVNGRQKISALFFFSTLHSTMQSCAAQPSQMLAPTHSRAALTPSRSLAARAAPQFLQHASGQFACRSQHQQPQQGRRPRCQRLVVSAGAADMARDRSKPRMIQHKVGLHRIKGL